MKIETEIRKHLKAINNLLPDLKYSSKQYYKETLSDYITIKLDITTAKEIRNIAYKEDKAVSQVCRELIWKGQKNAIKR